MVVFAHVFIALPMIAHLIGANAVQLSLISTFKQHIRIVAPYIDDTEEETLISEWSRMATRDDILAVQKKIEAIADAHSIELPVNRLYSIWAL